MTTMQASIVVILNLLTTRRGGQWTSLLYKRPLKIAKRAVKGTPMEGVEMCKTSRHMVTPISRGDYLARKGYVFATSFDDADQTYPPAEGYPDFIRVRNSKLYLRCVIWKSETIENDCPSQLRNTPDKGGILLKSEVSPSGGIEVPSEEGTKTIKFCHLPLSRIVEAK